MIKPGMITTQPADKARRRRCCADAVVSSMSHIHAGAASRRRWLRGAVAQGTARKGRHILQQSGFTVAAVTDFWLLLLRSVWYQENDTGSVRDALREPPGSHFSSVRCLTFRLSPIAHTFHSAGVRVLPSGAGGCWHTACDETCPFAWQTHTLSLLKRVLQQSWDCAAAFAAPSSPPPAAPPCWGVCLWYQRPTCLLLPTHPTPA